MLVDGTWKETKLGIAVRLAWNFIPSLDRQLMLFIWTRKASILAVQNEVAYSIPTVGEAQRIIDRDFDELSIR
jgi:hypothetical protein